MNRSSSSNKKTTPGQALVDRIEADLAEQHLASIHRRTSVMDVGFFNGAFWSVGVR
jgi:hypothetical protein